MWLRVHARTRSGEGDASSAIVEGWDAARARVHGSLMPHVRAVYARLAAWRPAGFNARCLASADCRVARKRCGGGISLASESSLRSTSGARLPLSLEDSILCPCCGAWSQARRLMCCMPSAAAVVIPTLLAALEARLSYAAATRAVAARLRDRHSLFGAMAGLPCKFTRRCVWRVRLARACGASERLALGTYPYEVVRGPPGQEGQKTALSQGPAARRASPQGVRRV